MKLRTLVKISITTSVALLCTGFAVFSFFKLSAAENKEEFDMNFQILIKIAALIQDINLSSSETNHFFW